VTLEQVLADERGQAAVLRAKGHPHDAALLEALCDRVADAAEDYIRFISESDARLRSGWSVDRLKGRFPQWEREGHAEKRGRERYYRQLVIPQRVNPSAVRAEARRDGESAA
jgi:hypothetical protein